MSITKLHITDEKQKQIINVEIKLHINQRLFENGVISDYMYQAAKEIIIKEYPKEKPICQKHKLIPYDVPPLWLLEPIAREEVFAFYGCNKNNEDVELQVISDKGIEHAKKQAKATFKKRGYHLVTYTSVQV